MLWLAVNNSVHIAIVQQIGTTPATLTHAEHKQTAQLILTSLRSGTKRLNVHSWLLTNESSKQHTYTLVLVSAEPQLLSILVKRQGYKVTSHNLECWFCVFHYSAVLHQNQQCHTEMQITEQHPVLVPILVFLGLYVLDLGPMYATDVRQTSVGWVTRV